MAKKLTDGTIRKRADGRFEARITVGYDPGTGKQIQKSIYASNEKDIKRKLREAVRNLDRGVIPSNITLKQWLSSWIKEYKINDLNLSTYKSYTTAIDNHINPKLGAIKVSALTTNRLQQFINALQVDGVRLDEKEGGLSTAYISKIRNILHSSLEQARQNKLISDNPVNYVVLPKQHKKKIKALSVNQQKKFLEATDGHSMKTLFVLALSTGLRRGELLGLTWDCIDFDNKILKVIYSAQRVYDPETNKSFLRLGTTKTDASVRKVPITPSVIPLLYTHKEQQETMRTSSDWNPLHLVFCNAHGGITESTTINRMLNSILRKAELPKIGIHALRHTFATRMLENDVPAKVVQELLGHTDIALTLNTYTHILPEMAQKEISKIDNLFKDVSPQKKVPKKKALKKKKDDLER